MINWFRNLMIGRYGPDQLSIALVVLFVVLALSGNLTDLDVIRWISLVPLVLCILRILSQNTVRRRLENEKFLSLWNPVANGTLKMVRHVQDCRVYRFFKCPNPQCRQKLRVPKGRGTIEITCPKCHTKIIKRT